MRGVNAATVVADDDGDPGQMTFYAISDSVDPVTGRDSRSGKTIPGWLTQVSSLSREQVLKSSASGFAKFGLDVNDYVQEVNVTAVAYSDLMAQALRPTGDGGRRAAGARGAGFLVPCDRHRGFYDCNVVGGMSPQSPLASEVSHISSASIAISSRQRWQCFPWRGEQWK